MSFFQHPGRKIVKYRHLAALLLLFGLYEQANSQSGRRATKPSPPASPSPAPQSTPEPQDIESTAVEIPGLRDKVQLLIGRQHTRKHLQSEDVILASFVKRLNEFKNVGSTSIGEIKKHDQAVARAKAETEAFVVLLSFAIDSIQGGTIILNSPDLVVEYLVLGPRTGKKETKGKLYFQAIGGGRMRKSSWPGGTPIKITPEAAGIEAAEYVHDWLRLTEAKRVQP